MAVPGVGPVTAADWIDDLERKAKAATPGPWYAHGPVFGPNPGAIGQTWGPNRRNDAKFIAAVNPTTILRLIEAARRAEDYNAEAERHAARVVALEAQNEDLRTTVDADLEYQRRLEARLAAVIRAAGNLESDLRATRVCYTDECGEPCRSHVAALWAERDAARKAAGVAGERLGKERAKVAEVQAQRDRWKAAWEMALPLLTERDALAAKVAAVEALAAETEQAGDPLLRLDRLRAALSATPTDTTKETDR